MTDTMDTAAPALKAVLLSPRRDLGDRPLLVLGPSLGTSTVLWNETAALLADEYDVIGWDLPGHGVSPAAQQPFRLEDLATSVLALVDSIAPGTRFHYAGVSLGGAVGLQLALDHGDRLLGLSVQCSGPKLATEESWLDRAGTVRTQGTAVMIQGSAQRWFAAGFMERRPEQSSRLLHVLRDSDRNSYAACCEALAAFDVRDRLGGITVPVQLVAGVEDQVAPPSLAEETAAAISAGGGTATVEVLDGVSHLAPTEAPETVAALLRSFLQEVSA
ncbi:3-oxoadipate enol-lactonase [Arthrobacter woluwensis]|uniref:3-oxoadipate enol-lactonase n=2 Tax=Arthrobacter woluwensis TaxID=156980 RepID=A0A1H4KXJ9_9MICC|nr:3-oxoadipate enol-lactonase [Arthrobacter woluwensis]